MDLFGRQPASLMPPISSRPDMNSREAGQRSHRSRIKSRERGACAGSISLILSKVGGAVTAFAIEWLVSGHKSPQDTLKAKAERLRRNPAWPEARRAKFVSRDPLNSKAENSKAEKQKRIRP